VVPRAVSAVRLAAGGSALAIDDPALSRPGPLLSAIAHSPVSIVICAETGAGKEVLSRALHALSGRPGPFLGLNCAALAPQLLESELFGHDKGAFTGAVGKAGLLETAAGGSVLLDEIADMPREVQVKLLRAIEAREVLRVGGTRPIAIDVRFLAASHRPLPEACAAGAFRPDLYYRLAGITLTIPPLRERPAQIAQLAIRFALAATGRNDALSAAALARLAAHAWPGNVRELKNVVERAALLAGGDMIELDHLLFDPIPTSPPSTADASTSAPTSPVAAPATPAQLRSDLRARDERARIDEALGACGGNQTAAARRLGMSRATLTHRLDLLGIVRPRKR
jgi:DNA-binding NtrC family response regulator